ncbi:hypothetical protein ACJA25_02820 [Mycoplasmopsis hyopharyngis]
MENFTSRQQIIKKTIQPSSIHSQIFAYKRNLITAKDLENEIFE